MSIFDFIVQVEFNKVGGFLSATMVRHRETTLHLVGCGITSISSSLTRLTLLQDLHLSHNKMATVPLSVVSLTALRTLELSHNLLETLDDSLNSLVLLEQLYVNNNRLTSLSLALPSLRNFDASSNFFSLLPRQLATMLPALVHVSFRQCERLHWLPRELASLRPCLFADARLVPQGHSEHAPLLPEHIIQLSEQTPHFGPIRQLAADIAIGLADLELPALVTLEIVDAALPNCVKMAAKWDLVVLVKHWRDSPDHSVKRVTADAPAPLPLPPPPEQPAPQVVASIAPTVRVVAAKRRAGARAAAAAHAPAFNFAESAPSAAHVSGGVFKFGQK